MPKLPLSAKQPSGEGQKTGVEYKPFNDGDRLKTASKWSGAK
jgi:hypothetical protein